MNIAIYGAGSLGTVMGAYLAKAGVAVDLVNRNEAHVNALRENGARITGKAAFTQSVNALLPSEMKGPYDLIFLMTKQLENTAVVEGLLPFMAEDAIVCTMQNGIPEPSIAQVIGEDRVMGATVAWGATMVSPGVVELTSDVEHLSFGLGRMNGKSDAKLGEVRKVIEMMCPVEMESDFMGVRWSKLLINAAFSGMGTVMGGTFGEVAADKRGKRCALYVIRECVDVARANGYSIAPMQGKDIVKLLYFTGPFKRALAGAVLPVAIKAHANIRPSMLQDIEKGKRCEIDAINGVVCEFGRKAGVATPYNDKIVEIVHAIERGEKKPGMANLDAFEGLSK